MKKVTLHAPAKLNLALDVTGRTGEGYHTLDMVMQAITLYERVEVAVSRGYSLRCPGSRVPANNKNTATKAAAAFFYETGLLAGADITLHKAVPTRAGMGGGSADAAAVLVGLNELYAARLTPRQLAAIGAKVGADVPFALLGGTARVSGIGEVLQPLAPLAGCWFAVAMPAVGVSTPEAFARYDKQGSSVHPDVGAAATAIEQGDVEGLARHMQNALEAVSGDETTQTLRQMLDAHGALASAMTGSGAAVFGLFRQEAAARAAATALQPLARQVFVAQPETAGPRVVQRL